MFLLNETTGAFDWAQTHDLYITNQSFNTLRHAYSKYVVSVVFKIVNTLFMIRNTSYFDYNVN